MWGRCSRAVVDKVVSKLVLLYSGLKAVQCRYKRTKCEGPFSMGYTEQGSHARKCVFHTGYTSRMGIAKGVAKGRSRHKNNSKRVTYYEIWKERRKERGHCKGKSLKQGLTSTKVW